MSDQVSIALITAGYSGAVGVLGWGLALLLRRGSLRTATIVVAVVAVAVFVAGLAGTSRAMFLSRHDLGVTGEVSVVAGLVALVFGIGVGATLARRSRSLQVEARAFGETGVFRAGDLDGPAELRALAGELERASVALRDGAERERRLDTSRRELVAWVSHDLRTPLAGLRAMAEALEDGMVDDPSRYHRRIRVEVERMGQLVDDLFELSRIQSGALALAREEVALDDLVSDAVAGLDPVARTRGVRLVGAADTGLLVRVDPARMSRVLRNLLGNAVRHTPDQGTVEVTAHAAQDAEGTVEVSVRDACGGIPTDEIGRVFDVAWRGSAARTPATGGAGLGLAIVKGLVEAHRGTVEVRNAPPGCQFVLRLPA